MRKHYIYLYLVFAQSRMNSSYIIIIAIAIIITKQLNNGAQLDVVEWKKLIFVFCEINFYFIMCFM